MATILSGDITVEYFDDNRKKRLSWSGGASTTYTMNEVYSAMATLLDETGTIDDGTCFSAETPTEYTIGKIDTGDMEPWYITYDCMEHITGGALRTSGWTRVTDTNTGIICVPVDPGGTIAAADEGYDVTGATTGAGTLLEFIDTGGTWDYLIIRPDGSASSNDFTTVDQVITSSRGAYTAVQWDTAASTTGEQIWANLYSLGTIDSNVHLYIYQGAAATDGSRTRVFSWNDATQDWYGNGHIDVCVALKDIEQATWTVIDQGYLSVFGRKYGDLYSSYEVACSTTSGGRNPIPLQTAADLDNTTGILTETFDGTNYGAGWSVGDIMTGDTSGARGIVTAITSPGSTQTVTFIPIDDPLGVSANWTSGENVTSSGGGTGSFTDLPADAGPATSAWFTSTTAPTISFTHTTADIDDDSTNENYGITIDCNQNPLTEVYEWCKYATRNGETTNDLDGINGELYVGGEVYLAWSGSVTGTIQEGSDVTQATTLATGVIVSYYDSGGSGGYMLLRNTRGTFNTSNVVTDNDQSGTVTPNTSAVAFAPKTASPLGTFAGGTFFGARGVLLTDYLDADANSFVLTPCEGGTKERPATFTFTVTNLSGGAETSALHDRVTIYRLDGSSEYIDKTEYACSGGEASGAATIVVTTGITQDTVGKSGDSATRNRLVLVDTSDGGAEYVLRYSGWATSTFTLDEITGTATSGTNATTLINSGATFTDGADQVFRGDLVYVAGRSGWAYVKSVDSDTQLTLEGTGISGFVDTDTYEINVTPIAITSSDYVYVPFIHRVASGASETISVVYVSTVNYRCKVRNTRASTKIKPFSVDGSTSGTDVPIATIRTEDTIFT